MLPCSDCKHRGAIPGNAHIRCNFDWKQDGYEPPEGDEQGVENGWFIFPINFDPTWGPDECDGYEEE